MTCICLYLLYKIVFTPVNKTTSFSDNFTCEFSPIILWGNNNKMNLIIQDDKMVEKYMQKFRDTP